MSRAVLSIGSNIGDRLAHLQSVVEGLGDRVDAVSAVYSTSPWGGVAHGDFLNAVVIASDPRLDCHGWLDLCREFEERAQRVRQERWGSRTLDVDVVVCDDVVSADPDLTLPHPRAHERAFVLVPWLDVDPDARLKDEPVSDLVAALPAGVRDDAARTELTLRP